MNAEQGKPTSREPWDIRDRSLGYALRAIRLFQHLQKQKDGAGWVIGKQYLKAATSVGANIAEAQAGETRADFIHKLGIAQKEARESLYCLRLQADSQIVPKKQLDPLTRETEDLIAVLTSIIVKSKRKQQS